MTPPGTVKLIGRNGTVLFCPKPTDDYDDTLNWSTRRKALHYLVILIYVGVTFAFIDVQPISDTTLRQELSMTRNEISAAMAVRYTGLGLAGIGLIPFSYRYGRRPFYLLSNFLQLLACIWFAVLRSKWEYFAAHGLSGIGAAISQALVPMTIADLFFTHQFATVYGFFMLAQGIGAFCGPLVAGLLSERLHTHTRWLPWSMTAIMTAILILTVVGAEESTFVPNIDNHDDFKLQTRNWLPEQGLPMEEDNTMDLTNLTRTSARATHLDLPPGPRPWRMRFSLCTRTGRPIRERFLSCFVILVTFPGVAYAALTYGFIMAWLFIIVQTASTKLAKPPYNFDSHMIGLFNLGPLLGHLVGTLAISRLSDDWIVRRARANIGIYEPEMRLWFALGAGVLVLTGMLVFGLSIGEGAPVYILVTGYTLFSLGFGICLETALTYITDCYHNMIGDAVVGVAFVRNALAALVWFTIVPWIDSMGVRDVFLIAAATAVLVLLIPVPLLIWGRCGRVATAAKYRHYSLAAIPPATLSAILFQDEYQTRERRKGSKIA